MSTHTISSSRNTPEQKGKVFNISKHPIPEGIFPTANPRQGVGSGETMLSLQDQAFLFMHSGRWYYLLQAYRAQTNSRHFDDELLRTGTSSITNISFQGSDPAWTQASLPVKHGGLGIRSAVQLAHSAFFASAAWLLWSGLQDHFNASPTGPSGSKGWRTEQVVSRTQQFSPTDSASHRQREWDSPRIEATDQSLLKDAADERSKARLLASSRKESGAWLNALPVAVLGLRMDDETTRIAVGLRLDMPSPGKSCILSNALRN